MNKPITVAYEDLKQDIASLINNSGLPAFAIRSILKDYLDEVETIIVKQYQSDKAKYEMALLETKEYKDVKN
jgi:hypothetical protein